MDKEQVALESDEEILSRFLYENRELELLEDIAGDFNVFVALNIVENELKHSAFLSWLMNPRETHGLGDYFLKTFLKKATYKASSIALKTPSIFKIDECDFDGADVLREWKHIDLLIRSDDNKFICVIENKVRSTEHSKQLERYKDIVLKEYPNYEKLFVYLTVEGERPEEEENYLPMSYNEIVALINHLRTSKKDRLSSEIYSFIHHYEEMLRRYIVEDSQIQYLCRSIYDNHKTAIDLINKYKPDKTQEIHDLIVEELKKDPNIVYDSSNKTTIRFIPKELDFVPHQGQGWYKTKRILLFEILNAEDRIVCSLIIGPGPQDIRRKLHEIAIGNKGVFGASRKLTDSWYSMCKTDLLNKKEIEDNKPEDIKDIFVERFKKYMENELPKIKDELAKFK